MNFTTTDIQLFQILKQKIGEQEAEALVGFVDSKIKENNEANLKILATKEDIASLKGDITKLKGDLETKIAGLEGRLESKIADAKAELMKWMFIFWTGSILTTLGGMFAFLKIFLGK